MRLGWRKQVARQQTDTCQKQTKDHLTNTTTHTHPLSRIHKVMMPVTVLAYTLLTEATVYAAEAQKDPIITGSWKLIRLLQRFAFPVGVGVAIWGAIEFIMDNPGGKDRIKKAVIGYILVFIIPIVFITLKDAFDEMVNQDF